MKTTIITALIASSSLATLLANKPATSLPNRGSNNSSGQFEAYLAKDTLSAESAIEYRKKLQLILDYLDPNKTKGAKIKPAYNLLSKASQYPGDGNSCKSIASAIYLAKLSKNQDESKKRIHRATSQRTKKTHQQNGAP